jgi:hypothetical protein
MNEDNYKVWAEDETAYGPVEAATLRQWIRDGRVIPETFVQPQSHLCWRRAAEVEALRDQFPDVPDGAAPAGGEGSVPADALGQFSVFANLSAEELAQLAALGKTFDVATDTLIVRTGDPCDAVYFVLAGGLRVRLLVGVVDQQDKTLCQLGTGEFFGELGMFLQSKRTADVVAQTDSRLFRIDTNAFRLLVKQIPALAAPILYGVGVTMAQRIAEDNQRFYREVTSQFLWA